MSERALGNQDSTEIGPRPALENIAPPAQSWHLEPTFWAVLALALGGYFLRVTTLPVFGEETRRGVIAREMIESGDWIVPRVQGVPRLSRPPLQNWMIAAVGLMSGSVDVWAVRLPSLIATLLTVALVYVMTFRCAGSRAAFLAACAYATMFQVLEFGRLGETEAVFSFFVAGSMLIWRQGDLRGKNRWLTWTVCYLLVAGGMLTKGLQAPVYFVGAVGIALIIRNRFRELFQPAHLTGAAIGVACIAAWQFAFMTSLGWEEGWQIYFMNVAGRFDGKSGDTFLGHLAAYPFETFGVMLPWSVILLAAFRPTIRGRLAEHRETVQFLVICLTWAFLFVWLPPGSRTRYFMPLMPCVAVLIGLVGNAWLSTWQPAWTDRAFQRWIGGVAAALTVVYLGPVLSYQARRCDDISGQIAALKSHLPAGERLSSLDQLHHGFLYHYGEPIRLLPVPDDAASVPDDLTYFAVHTYRSEPAPLPFEWELVQMVSCDRFLKGEPRDRIYIGRRIASPADSATASNVHGQPTVTR